MANPRVKTFKALSALLTYPTEELKQAAGEIGQAIAAEGIIPARDRAGLDRLIEEIATRDLYDLQERYTLLFDRSRSLSLHLFEHVHGESRDRGQAMLDLAALYEKHGFRVAANELPDYLPMFLEFLSLLPANEAKEMLEEPAHILAALEARLNKRKSIYASVFRALKGLSRGKFSAAQLAELVAGDDAPDDLAALDAEWEETAVTFGPGDPTAGSCGTPRLATRLRAAARSAAGQGTN
jgi:nitrate reductase delta subunit